MRSANIRRMSAAIVSRPLRRVPSRSIISPSSANTEETVTPLRWFHPARKRVYSARIWVSCGWPALNDCSCEWCGSARDGRTLVGARTTAAPAPSPGGLGQSPVGGTGG